MSNDDLLTTTEAAAVKGVTAAALRMAVSRGRLVAVKRGRDLQIKRSDLLAYEESKPSAGRKPSRPKLQVS